MVTRDVSKPWIADLDYFSAMVEVGNQEIAKVARKLVVDYGIEDVAIPRNGYDGLRAADDTAIIPEYSKHNKDLVVGGLLFEVKSRKLSFTSPKTFPFETAFVDTVASFEAKEEKPAGYIFVSQITGALLVLSVKQTRAVWTIERAYDTDRRIQDDFYMVSRRFLRSEDSLIKSLRGIKK